MKLLTQTFSPWVYLVACFHPMLVQHVYLPHQRKYLMFVKRDLDEIKLFMWFNLLLLLLFVLMNNVRKYSSAQKEIFAEYGYQDILTKRGQVFGFCQTNSLL